MLSSSQIELAKPDIVRTEVRWKEHFDISEITAKSKDLSNSYVLVVKPKPIKNEKRLRIAKAKAKLKILNLLAVN